MRARGIFCNRTLNMRSIRAIGYDMDYTLVHYRVDEWERRAYGHIKQRLWAMGWPVDELQFDPSAVIRGLVIDTELGNLVKANRFGFVKHAAHGTRELTYDEQRATYARSIVDLTEPRWYFLNTFFSISEACLYAQLVDLLDHRRLPGALGYADLFRIVRETLDASHMEGKLKGEILAEPGRFALLDPDVPLTLLDQKHAGKKLLLITNSDWSYTAPIMSFAFDPFLGGSSWRELFDVAIIAASKPEFFTTRSPFFEVATDDGLLRPVVGGKLASGKTYFGGSAREVEAHLGLSGDEILYVGDHLYGDVQVTKNVLRWRTALIVRELEDEVAAIEGFRETEHELQRLMAEKEAIEVRQCEARVALQRLKDHYGPPPGARPAVAEASLSRHTRPAVAEASLSRHTSEHELVDRLAKLRVRVEALDEKIAPLAKKGGELANPRWGLLTRAGNDKSYLARQLERHADIYTSRVSNLLAATPFVYLRSHRDSLPHDP